MKSSLLLLASTALIAVHLRAEEPRTVPGLDLKLMPIPAGMFTMGSPESEAGRAGREGPQTQVTLSRAFWLGCYEVTQGQWRALMGTGVEEQARRMLADDTLFDVGGQEQTMRAFLQAQADSDPNAQLLNTGDNVPMYYVSHSEAAAFCRKLTERERAAGRLPEDYEYRLPTEAEWEYACRAGTTTATYAGDLEIKGRSNAPVLDEIAWYAGNSSVDYTAKGVSAKDWPERQYPGDDAGPHEAGLKQANAWGLYDMLGNVNEWCGDWYDNSGLPGGNATDPKGSENGPQRMVRGGSWYTNARSMRAAYRGAAEPGIRFTYIGFRVALAPALSR